MTTLWNMRTLVSALLTLSFMVGVAGKVLAFENDNIRDTRDAKQFFDKLQEEQGGGS
jgi:hypothetical protein